MVGGSTGDWRDWSRTRDLHRGMYNVLCYLLRYIHVQSLQEMLRKAKQHNSPKTVIFQRKIGCLRWDSNPRPSAFQAMLLPTEPPRQLSWLGRILHTNQKASQPDKQVKSNLVFRRRPHVQVEVLTGLLNNYSSQMASDVGMKMQRWRVRATTNTGMRRMSGTKTHRTREEVS